MSLWRFLLLVAVALLASATAIKQDTDSTPRLLRVVSGTDERTSLSSKVTDFLSKFTSKEYQVAKWAEAGKTDDFVKNALKIKATTETGVRNHKNYQYFKLFRELKLRQQARALVDEGVSTSQVWRRLGLGNVRTVDDVLEVEPTEAFKFYLVYLGHYDDHLYIKYLRDKTPIPKLSDDLTWAEKAVRAAVWGKTNRSKAFVEAALGIDNLTPAEIAQHKNVEFYIIFLKGHLRHVFGGYQISVGLLL